MIVATGALLALAGSAVAAPGVPIKPEPDTTPMQPVGASDRLKNGPSPLATPPADIGEAPDPGDPADNAPPLPPPPR